MNAASKFYQTWQEQFGQPIKSQDVVKLRSKMEVRLGYDYDRIFGYLTRAVIICKQHADEHLLDIYNPIGFLWQGLFGSSRWLLNATDDWYEKNGRR